MKNPAQVNINKKIFFKLKTKPYHKKEISTSVKLQDTNKLNTEKSLAFLYTNNEKSERN